MTPYQIDLARHALGLSRSKISYRNYFVTGEYAQDYKDWMGMVEAGNAKMNKSPLSPKDVCFWLTPEGAKKALKRGEKLCAEDFPVIKSEGQKAPVASALPAPPESEAL